MAQLKQACSVTAGNQQVVIPGVDLTARIRRYSIFMVEGELVPYTVAVDSTYSGGNTLVTLSGIYKGATNASANGVFATDFTYPDLIPTISQGDVGTAAIFTAAMYRLQSMIATVAPGGLAMYQKFYDDMMVALAHAEGMVFDVATYATNAENSANASAFHATNASGSASTAAGHATSASNSVTAATGQVTLAANQVTLATTQATNSANSATLAQNWAIKMGTPVSGGEYSAKYWADQARIIAAQVSAGQIQADWNEADTQAKGFIKNKPAIPVLNNPSIIAGLGFIPLRNASPQVMGADTGRVFESRNSATAGNDVQFYIEHSLANVNMGNQRGTLNVLGNATTATTLRTGRLINGTSFNGGSDISVTDLRGNMYITGGQQKPNDAVFGPSKLRLQMLQANNIPNIAGGATWNDVLWMSSYSGNDVKGSNALVLGKTSEFIGFMRQDYDSATWGTLRTIWHSGNMPAAAVEPDNSTLVQRTTSGYINAKYFYATDDGNPYSGTGLGAVTSIICKRGDDYYRSTSPTPVKAFLNVNGGDIYSTRTDKNFDVGISRQLRWSNYGDNHIIFDASSGLNPSGLTVNNTNSNNAWVAGHPVLMGFNGDATYGVRVDSARLADFSREAPKLTGNAYTNGADGWFRSKGACGWYNETYTVALLAESAGLAKITNGGGALRNLQAQDIHAAGSFNGPGTGLTGTAASLKAGTVSSIASNVGENLMWTGEQKVHSMIQSGVSLTTQWIGSRMMAYTNSGGPAFMSFHRDGYQAYNFGIDIDGQIKLGGWSYAGAMMTINPANGDLTMAGNVIAYSDIRLKRNLQEIRSDFVQEWAKVRACTYYRTDREDAAQDAGLIAQDVKAIMPQWTPMQADGYLGLSYGPAAAVASVMNSRSIVALEKEVDTLKAVIGQLMARIEKMESKQ